MEIFHILSPRLKNLAPTRVGHVNTERIDPRHSLVSRRVHDDAECRLPMVLTLDRTVKVSGCLGPFDFKRTVARGQNRPNLYADGFRRSPLLRRIAPVELGDKRLRLTATCDVCVHSVNRLTLSNAIGRHCPEVLNPVEERCAL